MALQEWYQLGRRTTLGQYQIFNKYLLQITEIHNMCILYNTCKELYSPLKDFTTTRAEQGNIPALLLLLSDTFAIDTHIHTHTLISSVQEGKELIQILNTIKPHLNMRDTKLTFPIE